MVSLSNADEQVLAELYARVERTVDDLPYTEDFETLYTAFVARTGKILTRHDLWRALTNMRKARKLIRKQR